MNLDRRVVLKSSVALAGASALSFGPAFAQAKGGIINVALEYLEGADRAAVDAKIAGIPDRLNAIWDESAATGDNPAKVADRMAQKLIGRG